MGHCVLGCSGLLHSPVFQSFPPFSSPPPSSSRCCPALLASHREVPRRKLPAPALASCPEGPRNQGRDNRRALLLVGLSTFPLLQLRALAAAVEDLVKEKQDTKMTDLQGPHMQDSPSYARHNEIEVQAYAHQAPANSFLSLLNGLGIIGSGVLGALYAISQKEKADMESEIESGNNALSACLSLFCSIDGFSNPHICMPLG